MSISLNKFYYYQALGWVSLLIIALLVHSVTQTLNLSKLLFISTQLMIGFFLSILLRYLFRWLRRKKIFVLLVVVSVFIACILFGILAGLVEFLILFYSPIAVTLRPDGQLMLVAMLWSIAYFSIKNQQQTQSMMLNELRLQDSLKQSRLEVLLGQLEPHFLFNTVNNIRALILEDSDKARDLLGKFSIMLRYNLLTQSTSQVSLSEEVSIVENYLHLVKIQFEEKLRVSINVEPKLGHISVPRMMLQLLAENAIKHGISHLENGGEFRLDIYRQRDDCIIEASNHGRLSGKFNRKIDTKSGLGIKNIQERLKYLYENKAEFNIEQINDRVVVKIKLIGAVL